MTNDEMKYEQFEKHLTVQKTIAKELNRIAEVLKMELWLKMENEATDRQKGIISAVLKTL